MVVSKEGELVTTGVSDRSPWLHIKGGSMEKIGAMHLGGEQPGKGPCGRGLG